MSNLGKKFAALGVIVSGLVIFSASSHEGTITEATDIVYKEWQNVMHAPEGLVDRQVKVVDLGNSNVAVGVLFRDKIEESTDPVSGIIHNHVSEVYYITKGSGVLVTGGTPQGRRDIPEQHEITQVLVGESYSTTVARGDGQVREVTAGDIIVIPAGVFHGWHSVDARVEMLSVRPDPENLLPEGYVNPFTE